MVACYLNDMTAFYQKQCRCKCDNTFSCWMIGNLKNWLSKQRKWLWLRCELLAVCLFALYILTHKLKYTHDALWKEQPKLAMHSFAIHGAVIYTIMYPPPLQQQWQIILLLIYWLLYVLQYRYNCCSWKENCLRFKSLLQTSALSVGLLSHMSLDKKSTSPFLMEWPI